MSPSKEAVEDGNKPHHYYPSTMHMGDCSICGCREQDNPNHINPRHALSAQPVQGEAEPVAVTLEWSDQETARCDEDPTLEITGYEADTPFGVLYHIEVGADGFHVIYDYQGLAVFQSPDEAKAAAQADFEARVRSCLAAPQPKQPAPAQEDADFERMRFYVLDRYDPEDDVLCALQERLRSKQAPTAAVPSQAVEAGEVAAIVPGSEWITKPQVVTIVPHAGGGVAYSFEGGTGEMITERFLEQFQPRARAEQREAPGVAVGERTVDALRSLEKAATEVSRLGAQPGTQWPKLTSALIKARGALDAAPSTEGR
jgi:hypothetical protein